jgi:5-formyltetrahydrofolate cyclo-ligase
MPGLGFDHHGNRLGQGKGYYDTYFQELARKRSEFGINKLPTKIALAFDEQIVNVGAIPLEPHD